MLWFFVVVAEKPQAFFECQGLGYVKCNKSKMTSIKSMVRRQKSERKRFVYGSETVRRQSV